MVVVMVDQKQMKKNMQKYNERAFLLQSKVEKDVFFCLFSKSLENKVL